MSGEREFEDTATALHDLPPELFFTDKGPIGKHLGWDDLEALNDTSKGVQHAIEPAFRVRREFLKRQKDLDEKILQILRKFSHKLERGSVLHWNDGNDVREGHVWEDDFKDGFHNITFYNPESETPLAQKLRFKLRGDLSTISSESFNLGGKPKLLDPDILEARAEMHIVNEMRREFPKKFERALQPGTILRIFFLDKPTTEYVVIKDTVRSAFLKRTHETYIKERLGRSGDETPEICIRYAIPMGESGFPLSESDSYVYDPALSSAPWFSKRPFGEIGGIQPLPPLTPFERSIVQIR